MQSCKSNQITHFLWQCTSQIEGSQCLTAYVHLLYIQYVYFQSDEEYSITEYVSVATFTHPHKERFISSFSFRGLLRSSCKLTGCHEQGRHHNYCVTQVAGINATTYLISLAHIEGLPCIVHILPCCRLSCTAS